MARITHTTEVLESAVYELLQMQRSGQQISGVLGTVFNELRDMEISGNFLDLIVASMKKQETETGPLPEHDGNFVYNNSIQKTKAKTKGSNEPQSVALERIILKMQDLVHLISVTQYLISTTQLTMESTDRMIARMAVELMLESPELDDKSRKQLKASQKEVEEMVAEQVTAERLVKEKAVKEATEKNSTVAGAKNDEV